jgi:hypothetical protein
MERAAGFAHNDTAQARLGKLDFLLAKTSTPIQHVALFAEMLSLQNDERYPSLDELTSQQRRQKTLEALTEQLQALSRQNPVVMIFEDAHWTDPTSLEAFGRAVDRLRTLWVLLIVTFRPEFEPPWVGRPHVTALTLNRFAEREIAAMIDGVAGNKPLPADIRRDIVERADGIPLFIEEMTKAGVGSVLACGVRLGDGRSPVRRCLKPQSNSPVAWTRSRACRQRQRFVASRSVFKSCSSPRSSTRQRLRRARNEGGCGTGTPVTKA